MGWVGRPALYTLIACVVAVLLLSGSAHASGTSTRVVLTGELSDPVYSRIESELRLIDIQVDTRSGDARVPSDGDPSGAGGADAIVAVQPARVAIHLGRQHGGGELVVERRGGESPGLVALASVELLRARIVHPGEQPGPSASDDPTSMPSTAPESVPRDRSREERPWGLSLGPGIAVSAGGVPPSTALRVAADWRSPPGWYVGARVVSGLTEVSWAVDAGTCTQRFVLGGAAGGYAFVFGRDALALALGGGAAALYSTYETVPTALKKATEGQSGATWTGLLNVEASFGWHATAHLGVVLSAMLGAVPSEIKMPKKATAPKAAANADQAGASFGRPLAVVSLGLEARF